MGNENPECLVSLLATILTPLIFAVWVLMSSLSIRVLNCRRLCDGRALARSPGCANCQQADAKPHITNHFELLNFTILHQALESGSGPGGRRFKSS